MSRKDRGHWCRICGRVRPNEAFTGKGHKIHVCKKCAQMPKAERMRIEQMDEICLFLGQSNISEGNLARLRLLASSDDKEVAENAALTLRIAELHPRRRRRLKFLKAEHPDLLLALAAKCLVDEMDLPEDGGFEEEGEPIDDIPF